jgi:hypothetical protein
MKLPLPKDRLVALALVGAALALVASVALAIPGAVDKLTGELATAAAPPASDGPSSHDSTLSTAQPVSNDPFDPYHGYDDDQAGYERG